MATQSENAPGLNERFGAVRGYFKDKIGGSHYMPIMRAFDAGLVEHSREIGQWWNARAKLTEQDEPVLARMERVVEILKNAKNAA